MAFTVVNIFTPAIALGMGVSALFSSYLLSPVLRLCTREEGDMAEYENRGM